MANTGKNLNVNMELLVEVPVSAEVLALAELAVQAEPEDTLQEQPVLALALLVEVLAQGLLLEVPASVALVERVHSVEPVNLVVQVEVVHLVEQEELAGLEVEEAVLVDTDTSLVQTKWISQYCAVYIYCIL